MKLLLSGGSHRAGLGAIGAIGYLCWAEATDLAPDDRGRRDRWSDVDEVVSVSGGSMLNARIAAASSPDIDGTLGAMRALRSALLTDGMMPFRTRRRALATIGLISLLAGVGWVVASALGIVPPDVIGRSPLSFLVGLLVVPVALTGARALLALYLRDIADVVTDGDMALGDAGSSHRRHVICASGLSSGVPYYFVAGGSADRPFQPPWGAAITEGYTLSDAAMASGSLPGFGRVRAPLRYRRETLVDGGVSGSFGEQTSTTLRRRPEDTWRSDGDWFAVDAVRHLTADSAVSARIRRVSLLAVAFRWVKVSVEATYVNDLLDLGPGQYARVWTPNALPTGLPEPTGEAADLRRRLGVIQQQVRGLALTGFNDADAAAAVVAGFVATLEVRRGLRSDECDSGLAWLDDRLDAQGQLLAAWAAAATSTNSSNAEESSGSNPSTNR